MKKIGIIVEYNPLHNGHAYHLSKVRTSSDDLVIAIMSCNVCMRGEISVFNKFDKTSLALKLGVDLVIELPFALCVQSGDIFAYNAVCLLNLCNVDEIVIGSEYDNIDIYKKYLAMEDSKEFNDLLKSNLKQGNSFKTSYNNVAKNFNLDILKSNDTLGLFYYKAIKTLNSNILLKTIKRINNDYLDSNLTSEISSATAIRKNIYDLENQVPDFVYNLYLEKGFLQNNKIFSYVKYQISISNNLSSIFMCDEGIENMLKNINNYNNLEDFIDFACTKRYTKTRINRILLNILFNITKEEMKNIKNNEIDFIRVLGYNKQGQLFLNSIKKEVNIYTNIKEGINNIFNIEFKIDRVLDLIYNQNITQKELKRPIILD